MITRVKSIVREAEQLSVQDRIRLVEHLLATLDKPDPEIDRAWADECEERLDAYLRGDMPAKDADAVLVQRNKR